MITTHCQDATPPRKETGQQIKNKLAAHKAMITKADFSSYIDKNTTRKSTRLHQP
jgi:hypothetical protein